MNTTIPKLVTALGWAILIYNLLSPLSDPLGTWLTYGFWILLAAHIAEIFIFKRRIQASGAPVLNAILVLIFGYFRASELRSRPAT